MHEESTLAPTGDLSAVFPDIQGELCSKHSTLMGKLRHSFNQLYDSMEPSHFVVVKGTATIISANQTSLSFALENGIILMVARTFPASNVYLNGNHIDDELIFAHTGHTQEGLHELSEDFEKAFFLAVEGVDPGDLWGGIIYVHANIPVDFFEYKKALLLALHLSLLLINGRISQLPLQQIATRLYESQLIPDADFLEQQLFEFENRNFCLAVGEESFKLPFDSSLKFILCRLELANSDLRHIEQQQQHRRQLKRALLQQISQKHGFNSFYQIFVSRADISAFEAPLSSPAAQGLMQCELVQLKALCQFSNQEISIEQLLDIKWELDKAQYPEEVLELVQDLKQKTKVDACMIVENQFLLLAADKKKFAELICVLRQLFHKGELKSKSCFRIDEELVEDRWSNDEKIGEKIFAAAPSARAAIFDPCEAIWFD